MVHCILVPDPLEIQAYSFNVQFTRPFINISMLVLTHLKFQQQLWTCKSLLDCQKS